MPKNGENGSEKHEGGALPVLIRFAASNFRSFESDGEISFVATPRRGGAARQKTRHAPHGVVPVAGIWGPNASGKSNLLAALEFLRTAVADSFSSWGPSDIIPWTPFRLDRTSRPTTLDLDIVDADDVRYNFGFAFDHRGFTEEWLYRWENARRQTLYLRRRDEGQATQWRFGSSFHGQRFRMADGTRDNSLFLSSGAQQNHPVLTHLYRLITHGIRSRRAHPSGDPPRFRVDDPILDALNKEKVTSVLRRADIGITHFEIGEPDELPARRGVPDDILDMIRRRRAETRHLQLYRGEGDSRWTVPPFFESTGTNSLLGIMSHVLSALNDGALLIMDEIASSLHSELCQSIIDLFSDARANPLGAQLLFTTHATDLLRKMRPDQVWFTEKDVEGRSRVYSAAEFRGLRARDDLRSYYERGRFGSMPLLGDLGAAFEAPTQQELFNFDGEGDRDEEQER